MPINLPHPPKILQIAARIEDDIRGRNLQPGDAYLATSEVARMLGVSTSMANRAMQLLSQRHLLLRRQRSGAVIAQGIVQSERPPLRCIHFLVHRNYLQTEGLLADGVIIGMQTELSGTDVLLNYLAADGSEENIHRLIAAALRSPEPEGFVLVRSSLAVQRLIRTCGLPAVVFGSLYPSVHGLPWLDCDHRQNGRLLTEYLLQRNCSRVLCLSRSVLFPGDYPFLDGVSETLAKAGKSADSLLVRNLPDDHEEIVATTTEILSQGNRGLGIIARTERLAEGAVAAVEATGNVGEIPIAVSQVYRAGTEKPVPFPHIRNVMEPRQIGVRLGRMLVQLAKNQPVQPDHEIIPVELHQAEITHGLQP